MKKSNKSRTYTSSKETELALIKQKLNHIAKTVNANQEDIKQLKTKIDMGTGAVRIFILFCSLVSGLIGYKLFGD